MGIDQGFDLFPPLTTSDKDKSDWADFLDEVKKKYQDDNNMRIDGNGSVVFTVGEHPRLLKDGHRFRRFSAKISGSNCGNVELYLNEVTAIAKSHFERRVHPWTELFGDSDALYGWEEVYDAEKEA